MLISELAMFGSQLILGLSVEKVCKNENAISERFGPCYVLWSNA